MVPCEGSGTIEPSSEEVIVQALSAAKLEPACSLVAGLARPLGDRKYSNKLAFFFQTPGQMLKNTGLLLHNLQNRSIYFSSFLLAKFSSGLPAPPVNKRQFFVFISFPYKSVQMVNIMY